MSISETKSHLLRNELMEILTSYIQSQNMTQKQAAQFFGVTQPRISDLMLKKNELFSLDTLINFLTVAGFQISLDIKWPKTKKDPKILASSKY